MNREEKIQEQVKLAESVIRLHGYNVSAVVKECGNGEFGFHFENGAIVGETKEHGDGTPYTVVAVVKPSNAQTITNVQTGNPAILSPIDHDWGYTYIEQHGKYTIQASPDGDGTHNAIAWHIFDGRVGEVIDNACLDDALAELETHYGSEIRGWHAPQTLGL